MAKSSAAPATPYFDAKLLPLTWHRISDHEYHAHQNRPSAAAVVGKVFSSRKSRDIEKITAWFFECSAWGGNDKQTARGYMPTLEDAQAMVEIVTQGPRPSAHQALYEALSALKELLGDGSPYSVCRADKEGIDFPESIRIGDIFEKADAALALADAAKEGK